MAYPKKATDDELLESYSRLGTLKKVAAEYSMCAQSVHERLVKLNAVNNPNYWNEKDADALFEKYENYVAAGKLAILASELGRTKHFICRKARELGLTNGKRKKPFLLGCSERTKEWHKNNPHPKGMLGKKHSEATKNIMSKIVTERWANMTEDQKSEKTLLMMKRRREKYGALVQKNPRGSWKAAWREIGGHRKFYRSRWEANYARYLEWLKSEGYINSWEHEPETFWFDKIKRGTRSYLPDFRVTEKDGAVRYHEVKGWMDDRSKTIMNRMRIYHPEVTIVLIDSAQYRSLERKMSKMIPGWE